MFWELQKKSQNHYNPYQVGVWYKHTFLFRWELKICSSQWIEEFSEYARLRQSPSTPTPQHWCWLTSNFKFLWMQKYNLPQSLNILTPSIHQRIETRTLYVFHQSVSIRILTETFPRTQQSILACSMNYVRYVCMYVDTRRRRIINKWIKNQKKLLPVIPK